MAHCADITFRVEFSHLECGSRRLWQRYPEVQIPALQVTSNTIWIRGYDCNPHFRCFCGKFFQQWGEKCVFCIVGRGDPEGALRPLGIEDYRRDGGLNLCKSATDLRGQRLGTGRWDHAALLSYEQRVIQRLTQSAKHPAHSGLCEVQLFRRARDVLFAHQGVEDTQKVQVKT